MNIQAVYVSSSWRSRRRLLYCFRLFKFYHLICLRLLRLNLENGSCMQPLNLIFSVSFQYAVDNRKELTFCLVHIYLYLSSGEISVVKLMKVPQNLLVIYVWATSRLVHHIQSSLCFQRTK